MSGSKIIPNNHQEIIKEGAALRYRDLLIVFTAGALVYLCFIVE